MWGKHYCCPNSFLAEKDWYFSSTHFICRDDIIILVGTAFVIAAR